MTFPRQLARTRRFTLGVPRAVTISPAGDRVLFLRSVSGTDPSTGLWEVQLASNGTATERCLVDPRGIVADDTELPAQEQARRERAREQASGITDYATDRDVSLIAFAVGGSLFTHDLRSGQTVLHPSAGPVYDPRPSPDGRRVAYVSGDGLHVLELPGGPEQPGVTRPLSIEDGVSWGRAEFVAAEEMRRSRGYWWAPDSERVAVARVDERNVCTWYISDPAAPWTTQRPHRYPAAGTVNADVRLAVVSLEDGRRVDVEWDRQVLPYLASVDWGLDPHGADRLSVQLQSRDQRLTEIRRIDAATGRSSTLRTLTDPAWVELVPGSPAWAGTALVTVEDVHDHGPQGSRALLIDGEVVTPPGMQVRSVIAADRDGVVITASEQDPTCIDVHRWEEGALGRLSGTEPSVNGATVLGNVQVMATSTLTSPRPRVEIRWSTATVPSASHAVQVISEIPMVQARPRMLTLGERGLRAALLLPCDDAGHGRLPVVLDPYGGPHAQRVVASHASFVTPQWLADQGFAVLVVDGRGSPGRGPRWERELLGDLATVPLSDQLDALDAAARLEPRLDLERVGIRGWSFGGFLAALAVLRAPGRIRAAIAGAPVTDWRLYDTHYTERYLGRPQEAPEAYAVSSLIDAEAELGPCETWSEGDPPQLMVIHGLADDNVVAAHALRLSGALLTDGRAHRLLPLSGVTHMTPQEVVTERLLQLQVRFLRDALDGRDSADRSARARS